MYITDYKSSACVCDANCQHVGQCIDYHQMAESQLVYHVYVYVLQGFCSVLLALERLGLLSASHYQRLNPGAADIRWVSCKLV